MSPAKIEVTGGLEMGRPGCGLWCIKAVERLARRPPIR